MPLLQLPNGDYYRIPEGLTDEEALSRAKKRFPYLYEDPGFGKRLGRALKEGVSQVGESVEGGILGLRSAMGDTEGAQRDIDRMRRRAEEEAQGPQPISLHELGDRYTTGGVGAVLKALPSYIGEQVAQNAPSMAVPLAAGAGAAALSGPFAPIVGPLVGIGTYGAQQFGSMMGTQAVEGKRDAAQLEPGTAALTAAATAPLGYLVDRFVLGFGGLGNKKAGELIARELAARATGKTLAIGASKGLAEIPTELLETAAERYQAGLPLWDEQAKRQYIETIGSAGVVGTVGGMGGAYVERGRAQDNVQAIDIERARVAAGAKAEEERERAEAAQAGAAEAEAAKAFAAAEPTKRGPLQRDAFGEAKVNELPGENEDPLSAAALMRQQRLLAERQQSLTNEIADLAGQATPEALTRAKALQPQLEETGQLLQSITSTLDKMPDSMSVEKLTDAIEKERKKLNDAKEKGDTEKVIKSGERLLTLQDALQKKQPRDMLAGVPTLEQSRVEQQTQEMQGARPDFAVKPAATAPDPTATLIEQQAELKALSDQNVLAQEGDAEAADRRGAYARLMRESILQNTPLLDVDGLSDADLYGPERQYTFDRDGWAATAEPTYTPKLGRPTKDAQKTPPLPVLPALRSGVVTPQAAQALGLALPPGQTYRANNPGDARTVLDAVNTKLDEAQQIVNDLYVPPEKMVDAKGKLTQQGRKYLGIEGRLQELSNLQRIAEQALRAADKPAERKLLADFCIERDLIAICDEVWEHVVFDGRAHASLMAEPGMRERCVKIGSAGKIFSLTGWKVGWLCAAPALSSVIAKAHQFLTFTTPPNLQTAAAYGLGKDMAYFTGMRAGFARSRDRLAVGLEGLGYRVLPSAATYFLSIDLAASGIAMGDVAFCEWLVEERGVAAIPVSAFYAQDAVTNVVRLCFAKVDETIDSALERMTRLP